MKPLIEEIDHSLPVCDALERFADWPHVILFHSALRRPGLGRYSFLSADPRQVVTLPSSASASQAFEAFAVLRRTLSENPVERNPDLPPFQGGVAGLIGYEAGRWFERLPATAGDDEWREPAATIGYYDWVIAWDHDAEQAWVIVQNTGGAADAAGRLGSVLKKLVDPQTKEPTRSGSVSTAQRAGFESNFNRDSYMAAVARVIRYIRAGDIFQANLSQRLTAPAQAPPAGLYRRLADVNPAPFAAYFDAGPYLVISASPERFLRVEGDVVETRPIKGTRARRTIPEADLFSRDELRESEKDRAENVMIVDLLRNDLSRVCRAGTIRVPQLCTVETYETVQHLVSEVRGRLQPGKDFFDLLEATFPGGSITGAPKIRAMEIISELEQVPRGPYCGTMFFVSATGDADSSILIRTFTQANGRLFFPVGGGITAQSDPAAEYEETLHKAEGLLRALK